MKGVMMSAEELSYYTGIVLSLVCSYVPGVQGWYQKLDGMYKRLVMLLLLVITTSVIYAMACWNITAEFALVSCDTAGLKLLIKAFIGALIANQAVFLISPKKRS
jgi:hypothetical protein